MKNEQLTGKEHQLPENKGACSIVTQMIIDYFNKSVDIKRRSTRGMKILDL